MKSLCFILLLVIVFSCSQSTSTADYQEFHLSDSIKLHFLNLTTKNNDSVYVSLNELKETEVENTNKAIEKILKKSPQSANQYWFGYAFDLLKQKKYHEVLKLYRLQEESITDGSPDYFSWACVWAYIQPLGNRDSVYYYLEKAIQNDSLNPNLWVARSRFLHEDKRYLEAINDINKTLTLVPNDTSVINMRGEYKLYTGDFNGAVKDLEVVAWKNKDNGLFYLGRAIAYNQLSMRKNAISAADKAIQLDSTLAQAYLIRGNQKYLLGDKKSGLIDIEKAAKLGDVQAIETLNKYKSSK